MKYFNTLFVVLIILFVSSANAQDLNVSSNEVFIGKKFMTLALMQEQNGKRGFHLEYEKVKKPLSSKEFQLSGYEVKSKTYNFEKGKQTLLFRLNAKKGKEKRSILVLYSGMLSLVSGNEKNYFYVAEEYQKSIRYYAMFNSEPSFEAVSKIAESALENPDGALVATRWAGKESEVFIYDLDRLK